MDRETTQRLLRESIIFLCKTYLGADASDGFEIDSIICVSRRHGSDGSFDDPRPSVFKFHELVTEDSLSAIDDSQFYRSSMGEGLWQSKRQPIEQLPLSLNASKKRKGEDQLSSDRSVDLVRKSGFIDKGVLVNVNGAATDIDKIKVEVPWSQDTQISEPLSLQKGKHDGSANANADKTISKGREISLGSSSLSNSVVSSSIANCLERQSSLTGFNSAVESSVASAVQESGRSVAAITRMLPCKSENAHESEPTMDRLAFEKGNGNSREKSRSSDVNNLNDASTAMEQSVPRSCDVCRQDFSDFPSFNVHCTTAHGRFACPFCELSFQCESARERHLFEHTGEPVDEDSMGDELTSPSGTGNGVSETASHLFANSSFDGHTAMSSSAIELSSDNEDELMGSNGSYFDSHLLSRRGTISTHALRTIASLDPSRPFVCDVCRAQFEESTELCDHCALVHRRVPCPYCGRSFSQKASMERHQRQHTGERPYRCTLCHSSYTRKENLQTHLTRMHSISSLTTSSYQSQLPVPDFVDLE